MRSTRRRLTWFALVAAAATAGCSRSEPLTPQAAAAKGDALLRQMSKTLAGSQALAVTADETREQLQANGQKRQNTFTRAIVLRRPNAVTFVDKGPEHDGTGWYDGAHITIVSHRAKAWARGPMPATLDEALDFVSNEYAVQMPAADLLYSSPYDALVTEDTKGGWVDVQQIGGKPCDHLSYAQAVVDWEIWVGQDERKLPCQIQITYKGTPGKPISRVVLRDWNLAPAITATTFTPEVPANYQRLRILRHATVDDTSVTARPAPAPAKGK
jgi:hypothetical protein